jgi:hypothetical protein
LLPATGRTPVIAAMPTPLKMMTDTAATQTIGCSLLCVDSMLFSRFDSAGASYRTG